MMLISGCFGIGNFVKKILNQFSPNRGKCFTDVCEETLDAIRTQKYAMICINDSTEGNYEIYRDKLIEAFQSMLPEKSSFEK